MRTAGHGTGADGIGQRRRWGVTTAMTDGSNGAPEGGAEQDDDPFAYLYRPAEGESAAERSPRNSYARPMEVGRAQYGQQPTQQQPYPPQYQQQPPPRPQGSGAEQTSQLPHQQSRYAERSRPAPGEDAPRGRGKGPVIAVVAVVAAIAIGSGIALSGNDGKTANTGAGVAPSTAGHSTSATSSPSSAASPSGSPSATGGSSSVVDASKAQAQGAVSATGVKGAISADGSYLTLQPGSSVTWTVTVPTAGSYKFWLHFNNNGGDVKAAVSINGADRAGGVTFKNYGAKGGDQSQSWYSTNIWPDLQAGTNTLTVSAPAGAGVLIDQIGITGRDVNSYPSGAAAG